MNKTKAIIMAITVVLLIVVIIFMVRFITGTLFSATEALKQMGEAPLPTEQIEEKWIAPTMGPDDTFDLEQGIDSTMADGDFASEAREPEIDEDVQSVPVEETADELADTADAVVDDGTLSDAEPLPDAGR